MTITNNYQAYGVILLMGLATYLTRIGGYWLAGRLQLNATIKNWLNYLPGCILISIIAPLLFAAHPLQWLGAIVTGLIMWRTNNLLLAMALGVLSVALGNIFMPLL